MVELTREEIEALVPGRELNILVTERIFHQRPARRLRYSTDLLDAFLLVDLLRRRWLERDPHETMYWQFVDCAAHGWRVDVRWGHHDGDQVICSASETNLPLAICKVALMCER